MSFGLLAQALRHKWKRPVPQLSRDERGLVDRGQPISAMYHYRKRIRAGLLRARRALANYQRRDRMKREPGKVST